MKHCAIWLQVITFLLVTCGTPSALADLKLPILKSGTVTYSNVTVFSQTDHDLYISHAQGLGNVKISTLDDASLRALGLKGAEPESKSGTILANARGVSETMDQLKTSLSTANVKSLSDLFAKLKETHGSKITPPMIWGALAAVAFFYLFVCFCLKLICHNAGAPAGVIIWLPLLQMFPLLRAAKMSGWCFLLFLLPPAIISSCFLMHLPPSIINWCFPLFLVPSAITIWWSFRIAKACGKSALVGIMLILPGFNLLAFLYLAFSKGQPEESVAAGPIRLEGLTSSNA